jgi:hypothetical protein
MDAKVDGRRRLPWRKLGRSLSSLKLRRASCFDCAVQDKSCEARQREAGWRAMADDDEHYVYAIAL